MTTRRTLLAALPALLAAPAVVEAATDPLTGPLNAPWPVEADAVTKAYVDAQVPMTWDTPILPTQTGKMGQVVSMRCDDSRMSMFFRQVMGKSIANIDEAEDAFLSHAHVAIEVRPDGEEGGRWMAFAIRRQAAHVACRWRRGYGNVLLMHPDMIDVIGPDNFVTDEHFEGAGTRVGRWTRTAELPKWNHRGSTVFCSDHLPMNEAYVLYLGQMSHDAGAVLLDHGDGAFSMFTQGDDNVVGAKADSYVTRIIFKEAV